MTSPRSAAGAEFLAVQHVEVDVQPPAGSLGDDLRGGLAAGLCWIGVKAGDGN
jgi:hypothetical protein